MTRNRTIDLLRSRRLRPECEFPETLTLASGVEDDVIEQLDAQEVRRALRELPEEKRSLIELAFFSRVSHERLAAATGLPLGTGRMASTREHTRVAGPSIRRFDVS